MSEQQSLFGSNVQPIRRTKPKPKPWRCCGASLAGHMTNCPECRAPRP